MPDVFACQCDASRGSQGSGEETCTRFFAFSWQKTGARNFAAWEHLLWSFRCLQSGVWPSTGPDGVACPSAAAAGTALAPAGGDRFWFALPLFIKGDLEFMCNEVGSQGLIRDGSLKPLSVLTCQPGELASHYVGLSLMDRTGFPHWSQDRCCGLCLADRSGNNYKDHTARASWRQTTHCPTSFAARFQNAEHPLLRECCKMSHHYWALDILHIADYNGVSCHALANVLTDVIRDNEFHLPRQTDTLSRHIRGNLDVHGWVWVHVLLLRCCCLGYHSVHL